MTSDGTKGPNPRTSALIVGLILAALAAWNLYRQRMTLSYCMGAASFVLLSIAALSHSWSARFHRRWMQLALLLGWVNSRIILTLTFFGFITPIGFLSRLFGRDTLDRRSPARRTYWVPRKTPRQTKEQFERLF
ncbi:MAG: SxtJ family membrane protein [Bryobacteraceae bacterium]